MCSRFRNLYPYAKICNQKAMQPDLIEAAP